MTAPRIQIIDYQLGNLFSIQQACSKAGLDAFVAGTAETLSEVDGIILPGVGAFGIAMDHLRELDLIEPIKDAAAAGTPLYGICLGMQLLFESSDEYGRHEGLGLLPGGVRQLPLQTENGRKLRVPNVGWNEATFRDRDDTQALQAGLPDSVPMYFVHSFYCAPADDADVLTHTTYGEFPYCSGVSRGNILGTQFHPEKSGRAGIRFYENWAGSLKAA